MRGNLHHSPTLGYGNIFPLSTAEWTDLVVPATVIKTPASQAPTWTSYKGSEILAFADQSVEGNEERVFFVVQLLHSYKEGTELRPHVHWVGEDNTAGNVVWKMSYSWANIGEAFPTETSIQVTDANSTTTDEHNLAEFASITGTGKGLSSMLLCSLRRHSSNAADTYTGKDAYLLEFDIHYQQDTLGSQQEYSK